MYLSEYLNDKNASDKISSNLVYLFIKIVKESLKNYHFWTVSSWLSWEEQALVQLGLLFQ